MSRGTDFLTFVTGKIKQRLQETETAIQGVQKDIEGMNEYYWENYAEMDEYGYEIYDNQQALLMQMSTKQEHYRYSSRLKKMLDAPFFGSVDFIYDGEDEPESFYIGIGNFAEKKGSVPLIYDWRAPVASLFYDYDTGSASYEAPGGMMEGEISAKWQYKIRRGHMIYEVESDTKIDDDILKQELAMNGDVQLKNIVRTIQKEQNAIIRNTQDKILVIQGAAGSGKTSVALHRIAYLLYHDRAHLRSSDVLILSPNSVFSDYISHVLPELGEENIQEMSLDVFAYHELKEFVKDCEDRYDHIEKQMKFPDAAGEVRLRWKQSADFVQAMEEFLTDLEDRIVEFKRIEYRGLELTEKEIRELFYHRFTETPLLLRMEEVLGYFVDAYETLRRCTLAEEEIELLRERFMRMYVTTDVYEVYNWFLEDCAWPLLATLPREQRILEYEDVYPVLYLKQRLLSQKKRRKVSHLVIDEMQDYSFLQYVIMERLFPCRMTILGDRAQTMDTQQHDVLTFLPEIFKEKIRTIELNKSYRNTLEIAQYAAAITDVRGIEFLQRHGKEVTERSFITQKEALQEVCRNVRLGEDEYETAAVLTMTEEEAKLAYAYLKKQRDDVSYIDRNSTAFRKGLTVTTFYLAKGLEFDQAFLVGGERANAFFDQYRYISATRALHELYVYDIELI